MRKSINHILIAGALALTSVAASTAQNSSTGYFLQDYTYRFQMNPAVANSKNFVAIPGIGNINLSMLGTINATDIFYNVDGRTTTFMNPKVSAKEFLGNLSDVNKTNIEMTIPILAFGFKGMGGYNTVGVTTKSSSSMKVPVSMFSLLKEGISNKTYDIGAVSANARAYIEVSLGHSRDITKDLRVGANVKLLVGAANIKLDMKHADLDLGVDAWRIVTEGEITTNLKGAKYEHDINSTTGHEYVSGIDYNEDDFGTTGMGFAVDLGAVYKAPFVKGLTFSAAVLDLGFINWKNTMVASTQGQRVFSTDKYTFNVDDDAVNSFDNEFDKIKDEISSLYELSDLGNKGNNSAAIGATINLGAEYQLPVYKPMSFGLLNTTRVNGDYSWTDFRVSANWAPCKVFDAALSAGTGTFGTTFGWLANLHCPGINLFFGMDKMPTKFAKDMVPLSSQFALNVGLNVLF